MSSSAQMCSQRDGLHADLLRAARVRARSSRSGLAALIDEHHVVVGALAVDEMPESLQGLRILDGGLPLALVAADDALHVGLEFRADAERILA